MAEQQYTEHMTAERSAPPPDDPADLGRALAQLRAGWQSEPYPSAASRIDRLTRLIGLLVDYADRLCDAANTDYGHRSRHQTLIADIFVTIEALKHAKGRVRRWMRPEGRPVMAPLYLLGARAKIVPQPLGVVGVIGPWNFPINLLLSPLAGILSAGNRAFLKPSEHTPATSALLAEAIADRFAPDEIAVALGGIDVATAFSKLVYTGGERAAREVMRSAAENLTPVTLELGGKSPVFVSRTADLAQTARRLVGGKMLNSGQVCIAPDTVYVPAESLERLGQALVDEAARVVPDAVHNPDYSAVVNTSQYNRLQGYLDEVEAAGCRVLRAENATGDAQTRRMPMTVALDPPPAVRMMVQEIFGPIFVLKPYANFIEAIESVRAGARPLVSYYFGKAKREIDALLYTTISGGLVINDVIMQYTVESLPFGGVGASGMGAYHGIEGFRTFSHRKAVYRQTAVDSAALVRPPFTSLTDRILRLAIRR